MCHGAVLYFFALAAGAFFAAALAGAASFVDFGLAGAAAFSAFAGGAFFSAAGLASFAGAAALAGASACSAFGSAFFAAPLPPIDRILRIVCCWRWPALRR